MAGANICVSLAFSQDGSFISLFSDHRAGFPTKPPAACCGSGNRFAALLPVDRHEQLIDGNGRLDQRLLGHVADERLQRRRLASTP